MYRARFFLTLVCVAGLSIAGARAEANRAEVLLNRGAFEVVWYAPKTQEPARGLMIFGSGSGGWSAWEERVCTHLATQGWAVAGISFDRYGATDYSQAVLVADYERIVEELARRAGGSKTDAELPVVYGGWSTGAEQALPAAAGTVGARERLRGLLLIAPGGRGRYGLHTADKLGFEPRGEGTFALGEFAPQLGGLRLAQLHAGLDPLDSITWWQGTVAQVRLWEYPRAFHDFSGASDGFLALVDEALTWVLASKTGGAK
jgi:phosphatidylglycerol lysyltransferase